MHRTATRQPQGVSLRGLPQQGSHRRHLLGRLVHGRRRAEFSVCKYMPDSDQVAVLHRRCSSSSTSTASLREEFRGGEDLLSFGIARRGWQHRAVRAARGTAHDRRRRPRARSRSWRWPSSLRRTGSPDVVRPYYGVPIRMPPASPHREIVEAESGDAPLDLVIDDASHHLELTEFARDVVPAAPAGRCGWSRTGGPITSSARRGHRGCATPCLAASWCRRTGPQPIAPRRVSAGAQGTAEPALRSGSRARTGRFGDASPRCRSASSTSSQAGAGPVSTPATFRVADLPHRLL